MDPLTPTHYEVLGLEPDASAEQVEKAFRFCLSLYEDDAVALYSLLSDEEAFDARRRVHDAHEVLVDPARRREYDLALGGGRDRAEADGGTREPGEIVPFAVSAPPRSEEPPAVARTGEDLRHAREAKGVSLRDIAQRSKIGIRFLEYLEQERFDMLPAPVYIRGFVTEYARAVGLDACSTAEAYLGRVPRQQ